MFNRISELLRAHGLELFSPVLLKNCKITKKYLLEREDIEHGTAIMIAAPYYTEACNGASLSAYAVSRDYHIFYKWLFDDIVPKLKSEFPQNRFCGFADHSPIDERDAAARAGLGVIGKNGMLITKKYSSFVFIGELIIDTELECEQNEIGFCENCGACTAACPMKDGFDCLSAVTQKKGALTEGEISYIRKYGSVWGCDICQNACPHTKKAKKSGSILSPIPFFSEAALSRPTRKQIEAMDDGEFSERAFSWRGRDCILRNLDLIGENEDKKES